MVETFTSPGSGSVAILFHPSMVPVIDVFRSLRSLEDQYDLALLDGPEEALATYTRTEAAKGIISDALLLAFALTRERGRAFAHRPLGSRQGSAEEYCLLAMIAASRNAASGVASEAASLLGILSLDFMTALAGELVRQIDLGTLTFETPDLAEFRAMMGYGSPEEVLVETSLSRPGFNFRL